jgi:hypothetical protein
MVVVADTGTALPSTSVGEKRHFHMLDFAASKNAELYCPASTSVTTPCSSIITLRITTASSKAGNGYFTSTFLMIVGSGTSIPVLSGSPA